MMGETPKNLTIHLENTTVEGVISAATQRYREGLKFLDETTREELSHVYQTPAPAVNNGVLLTLDGKSIWTVTGTSYLTRLELKAGAEVKAPDGKCVVMMVNGRVVPLEEGVYGGAITLEIQ